MPHADGPASRGAEHGHLANGPRTTWAEEQAAGFGGPPLTAETVFLRAKYEKGGQKEVCDLLFALRGDAIVLSLKHQEDPDRRAGERLTRWCGKAARAAAGELTGAVRTVKERPFWCEHNRRGRVNFAPGDLQVRHAVACVETFESVTIPSDLPEEARSVPVTYLASHDLLNLIVELRSFPDLVDYLQARLRLPLDMRRTIGRERDLYAYYLLAGERFDGCQTFADVEVALTANSRDLTRRIFEKQRQDLFAKAAEYVSDSLSVRAPDYAVGLDAATLARYDPPDRRLNYMTMQEHLCDLRLPERRAGKNVAQHAWAPRRIEDGHGVPGVLLGQEAHPLLARGDAGARPSRDRDARDSTHGRGARAPREDGRNVIVDRDGVGFETALMRVSKHTSEAIAAGQDLFGQVRMVDEPVRLLPEEESST